MVFNSICLIETKTGYKIIKSVNFRCAALRQELWVMRNGHKNQFNNIFADNILTFTSKSNNFGL